MSHIQSQAGPSTPTTLNHSHSNHGHHSYYQSQLHHQHQPSQQHQQPQHQQQRVQPQPQSEPQYPQTASQSQQNDANDWSRSLKRLAKSAELKKHALTLQMHTAHVLSAHEALQVRNATIEDIKAQKNWLESERTSLLSQLQQVTEDRQKADALEARMQQERTEFQHKIQSIKEGEYAALKQQVDSLRAELGMTPIRSLQSLLDEKSAAYLQNRRLEQQAQQHPSSTSQTQPSVPTPATGSGSSQPGATSSPSAHKKKGRPPKHPRPEGDDPPKGAATGTSTVASSTAVAASGSTGASATGATGDNPPPRKRGRPKGSKNNPALKEARAAKAAAAAAAAAAATAGNGSSSAAGS